jgi:hypothetical protein
VAVLAQIGDIMPTQELDFGGDLSEARATSWIPKVGLPRAYVALGVPAGVVGTIAIQECAHARVGVAGTPYATQPTTQPTGGAAYRLGLDIETPAPYVRFLWTPGVGNDGADKLFTDDSLVAGTSPVLVPA